MIDDVYRSIEKSGYLNWHVVRRGLVGGLPGVNLTLSRRVLDAFLESELTRREDAFGIELISSLMLDELDRIETLAIVEKLCDTSDSGLLTYADRVWRLFLLKHLIDDAGSSQASMAETLDILNFWSGWGWPSDGPASMQLGSPREHDFSNESCQELLREINAWIAPEMLAVSAMRVGRNDIDG